MLDLLWLLLPVAAASGWYAARTSYRKNWSPPGPDFSSEYFTGLNYLLNEQPDKAIEVFIRMVEVDSDTVETHLALGNLFRMRGEVDRAIRIHQNLIARPMLSRQQRSQALFELGEDYMKAGLFDRAESLFLELVDLNSNMIRVLKHLLDIYQQEQDWEQAIAMCQRLETVTGKDMSRVIAQHYCEMAEQAIHLGDNTRAQLMIKRAFSCDKNCVRASILIGQLNEHKGDYAASIRSYKRVADQDIDYLPEVMEPLERCYNQLDDRQAMVDYLQDVLKKYDGISPILTLARLVREQKGDNEAISFLTQQLHKRPSVRGVHRLNEISLPHSDSAMKENLVILNTIISKLLEDKPIYECHHCGFAGKSLHWQCPSCKTWSSVKPIKGVAAE